MAYNLVNKCAKNCCKRTILVQLIVEDVVTCFLEHSVVTVTLLIINICILMILHSIIFTTHDNSFTN